MAAKLSNSLLGHIIGFVEDPRDHARMAAVCRNWHSGASSEITWGARYVRDYGVKRADDERSYAQLCRQVFQRSHCTQRVVETQLVAAHTDGERVYTISDGTVHVWNLESGKEERALEVAGTCTKICVDTQRIYIWDQEYAGSGRSLLAFDKQSGKPAYQIKQYASTLHETPTCFSDRHIFRYRHDGDLFVYQKEDGQQSATLPTNSMSAIIMSLMLYKDLLIARKRDNYAIYDAGTGRSLKELFIPKLEGGWDKNMTHVDFQCDEQYVYALVKPVRSGWAAVWPRLVVWNHQNDYRQVANLDLPLLPAKVGSFVVTQNEVILVSDALLILTKGTWKTKRLMAVPMVPLFENDVIGVQGARVITAPNCKGFVVHDFAAQTTNSTDK